MAEEKAKMDEEHMAEEHVEEAEGEEGDEEDIAAMKRRVAEMEEEAAKLRELQSSLDQQSAELRGAMGGAGGSGNGTGGGNSGGSANGSAGAAGADAEREDIDGRSIFVGNVDYSVSPEEIQAHFQSCGSINRVTILLDKFTGQPKGYAYVEFAEPSFVAQALVMNDSVLRNRNLKVTPKRTNIPGMNRGGFRGRGRGGFRGGRGGYPPRGGYRGGYRGGRGRGYAPY